MSNFFTSYKIVEGKDISQMNKRKPPAGPVVPATGPVVPAPLVQTPGAYAPGGLVGSATSNVGVPTTQPQTMTALNQKQKAARAFAGYDPPPTIPNTTINSSAHRPTVTNVAPPVSKPTMTYPLTTTNNTMNVNFPATNPPPNTRTKPPVQRRKVSTPRTTAKNTKASITASTLPPPAVPIRTPQPKATEALLKASRLKLSSSAQKNNGPIRELPSQSQPKPPLKGPHLSSILQSLDPVGSYAFDSEVEEQLLALANDFTNDLIRKAMLLAKHRSAMSNLRVGAGAASGENGVGGNSNVQKNRVEVQDVALVLRKHFGLTVPGMASGRTGLTPGKVSSTAGRVLGMGTSSSRSLSEGDGSIGSASRGPAPGKRKRNSSVENGATLKKNDSVVPSGVLS